MPVLTATCQLFETVGVQEVIDMTKEDLPCDQLSRKLLVKAIQVRVILVTFL